MKTYEEMMKKMEELETKMVKRNSDETRFVELAHTILDRFYTDGFYLSPHNGRKYRLCFDMFGSGYAPIVQFAVKDELNYDEYVTKKVDRTIKYLVDINKIDKFVEHLIDNVIPAFLDYKCVSTREFMFRCDE